MEGKFWLVPILFQRALSGRTKAEDLFPVLKQKRRLWKNLAIGRVGHFSSRSSIIGQKEKTEKHHSLPDEENNLNHLTPQLNNLIHETPQLRSSFRKTSWVSVSQAILIWLETIHSNTRPFFLSNLRRHFRGMLGKNLRRRFRGALPCPQEFLRVLVQVIELIGSLFDF